MPTRIHPSVVVGVGVELGVDVVVGPNTVLTGPLVIGDRVWIAPMVSIGTPAEYRGGPHPVGWGGEQCGAGVEIGPSTIIREFVTINQGTEETTSIGADCYLLARSHVGHDCVVGEGVTLADSVQLGGHTHVWAWANIGMGSVVHQRCEVGPGAMVGMGSAVRQPVAPFTVAVGNPARTVGVNVVGLQRRGCSPEAIEALALVLKLKQVDVDALPADLPSDLRQWLQSWVEREPLKADH